MVVVGVGILGNLNKKATSEESLGLAFWRIVISSGIVVVVMGVVNIFAVSVFVFRCVDSTSMHQLICRL